jgi:hypothetical protein
VPEVTLTIPLVDDRLQIYFGIASASFWWRVIGRMPRKMDQNEELEVGSRRGYDEGSRQNIVSMYMIAPSTASSSQRGLKCMQGVGTAYEAARYAFYPLGKKSNQNKMRYQILFDFFTTQKYVQSIK